MAIKKDASGKRSVQVEVEVPGTVEEVWQAIATGPGVSCWFVPTEIEGRVGGSMVSRFGPGMDSTGTVTEWDAPHRFAKENPGRKGSPPMATEWTVEAKSGGTCTVRVVHSLFASTDDWDNQLTGVESGWPTFFRILRLYLTHFRGLRGGVIQLIAITATPCAESWDKLTGSFGLRGLGTGDGWTTPDGAPQLSGIVQQAGDPDDHFKGLILLDRPSGVVSLMATGMGPQTFVQISLFFLRRPSGGYSGAGTAEMERLDEDAIPRLVFIE